MQIGKTQSPNLAAPSVDDCLELPLEHISQVSGSLTIMEENRNIPFKIARVFTVSSEEQRVTRGQHAHRQCHQICVCLAGKIDIALDDGKYQRTLTLTPKGNGLHILPGIWSKQTYRERGSILLVLCDQAYSEADYIRDYNAFLNFRGLVA